MESTNKDIQMETAKLAIDVKSLRKSFRSYGDKSYTLKERILHRGRRRHSVHEVLKGVDLTVYRGETVALIGQNGSGKSTLLKLMTGIIYPDSGSIKLHGKVSSLLELGAGFHPDFTGKENIYNNASIFGLSKKEIDQRLEKIVAFSELEEYIDSPVRTYSSGMYMRLAFSVAINVDAEILLIDEILAVGDANFQKKCMDMIRKLKRRGVTIVIVTHDMGSVDRICDRAVWLTNGKIKKVGMPREIIDEYLLDMDEKANLISQRAQEQEREEKNSDPEDTLPLEALGEETEAVEMFQEPEIIELSNHNANTEAASPTRPEDAMLEMNSEGERVRWGNGAVALELLGITDALTGKEDIIRTGNGAIIRCRFQIHRSIDTIIYGLAIRNMDGVICLGTNTEIRHIKVEVPAVGTTGEIIFTLENLVLTKGDYYLDLAVHSEEGLPYDYQRGRKTFMISDTIADVGIMAPKLNFSQKID